MHKKTLRVFMVLMLFFIICSACESQQKHKNLLFDQLNKITKMEKKFEKAGEHIQELEIKELESYEKIFSFKISDVAKRQETAKNAVNLLKERRGRIENESKLIHDIDIKIEELQTINIETKDEEFRDQVNQFVQTWKKRTGLYDQLNKKYKEAIEIDLRIYNLLSQKKVDLKNVKSMTKNTNTVYKDVIKLNDKLNLYTQKLNNERKVLYEKYGK
ncbi:YkyA family protein [Bacillus sp. EAC]|uniref:YkyA family protein n=1 Tax=Bacillus sp. EAC TaxID=1978338 RepID=UPI000B43D725|nr:YkyA family protein [Bacillus sp. EAC]